MRLHRGPDKYARRDLRDRIRKLRKWRPIEYQDGSQLHWLRAQVNGLLPDLVEALDRLDDAEALLDGGGR